MTKSEDAKTMQGKCSLENSVLENDLENASQQKTVTEIIVVETDKGFYVKVKIQFSSAKEWYVTTRRDRDAPKIYKDLNRLNEHLKEICPKENFILIRNTEKPKLVKKVSKKASKKTATKRRPRKRQ